MSELVLIKRSNEAVKSSVYRSHEYGCNYCIAPQNEQQLRKRGYHMTDNEIKDMLYNLPKEFKPFIRFIDDESKAARHIEKADKISKEVKEAVAVMKTEIEEVVEIEVVKEAVAKVEEVVQVVSNILETDYSEFDEDKLHEFKNSLKVYAKELGVKIHPALKDIAKIITKIKG